MRVFYFTVLLIVIAISITMGQAPHSFNYQAIIRDKAGAVVANKEINFRISITAEHQSGERVYSEIHRTFTNQFGVINLQIGEGEPLQGIMAEISWGASDYYLRVEVDAEGGYNFEEISNARLLSVPYSLWSQSAGYAPENQDLMKEGHVLMITGTDSPTEIDLSEYSQELSLDGRTLSISDGNSVELTSDIQDLSKSAHILTITGNTTATEIDLSNYEQELSLDGRTLSISNGNSVELTSDIQDLKKEHHILTITGNAEATEIDLSGYEQELSLDGRTLSISGGNSVTLESEIQDLAKTEHILTITGNAEATEIDLSGYEQELSLDGRTLSISGGNSVTLESDIQDLQKLEHILTITGNAEATEIDFSDYQQELTLEGRTLSISNGNSVELISDIQDLNKSEHILTITGNADATEINLSEYINTDEQTLSLDGRTLSISNGNSVTLESEIQDLAKSEHVLTITGNVEATEIDLSGYEQELSLDGRTLSISDGNSVELISDIQDLTKSEHILTITGNSEATEIDLSGYEQELSLDGRTLSISNGNSVTLESEIQDLDKTEHILTITGNAEATEIDLSNYQQELLLDGRTLSISDGNSVELISDVQDLQKEEHILTITGNAEATEIDLSEYINTDEQTLSLDGRTLSISNGNSVELISDIQDLNKSEHILTITGNADATEINLSEYINTDEQTLSLDGRTLSISNGNSVTLESEIQDLAKSEHILTITGNVEATEIDLSGYEQELSLEGRTLSISNGNSVELISDIQDLSKNQHILTITGNAEATEIDLSEYINTDEQILSLDGRTLSISNGNSVTLESEIQDLEKSEHILTITGNAEASEIDLSNYQQELSLDGRTLSISDGNSVELTSDIQDLTKSEHVLTITGNAEATEIDLSEYINTDEQTLSLDGRTLSISNGNSVTLESEIQDLNKSEHILTITGNSEATEIDLSEYINTDEQTLSLDGRTLSISNGNSVTLESEIQDLQKLEHILTITGNAEATEIDLSEYINTDEQTLSLDGRTLSISNGNSVELTSDIQDLTKSEHILTITGNADATEINLSEYINTDEQTLSLDGRTLSISDGNSVELISDVQDLQKEQHILTITGNAEATEIDLSGYQQELSLDGRTLSISDGNSVTLESEIQDLDKAEHILTITGNATATEIDLSEYINTDEQTLSLDGRTLSISNGNSVELTSDIQDLAKTEHILTITGNAEATEINLSEYINTDEQTLSLDGRTLSISNGNSVTLESEIQDLTKTEHILTITGNAEATEIDLSGYEQELSLDGRTLSISNGNSVELTSDIQDLEKSEHVLTITGNTEATEIDLSGYEQELSLDGRTLSISNGNSVELISDIQDLTKSAHILTITGNADATEIDLSGYEQELSLDGRTLSISDGNSVTLESEIQDLAKSEHILTITGNAEATEIDLSNYQQELALDGRTLSISNGNSVTLESEIQDLAKTEHILTITGNATATEIDLSNYQQELSLDGRTLSISNGNSVELTSDIQDLQKNQHILSITGNVEATEIDLSEYINTDEQTLSIDGRTLSISDGNSVTLESEIQDLQKEQHILKITGNSEATEIDLSGYEQELALDGRTLSISNGNSVTLESDIQDLSKAEHILTITGNAEATEIDLSNYQQELSLDGRTLSISDGNSVELISDIQDLAKSEHILTITGNAEATEIDLSGYEQELSLDGRTLSISNGNSVELTSDIQDLTKSEHILTITGNAEATEIDLSNYQQELSLDGRTLSISEGNSVTLESEIQDLQKLEHILTITGNAEATEIDLSDYNQELSLDGRTLSISNGNSVTLESDIQDLTKSEHILTITGNAEATEIDLSDYSQELSLDGRTLSISDGNSVELTSDIQDLNKLEHILTITGKAEATEIDLSEYINTDEQTLSLDGRTLSISNGNSVTLESEIQDLTKNLHILTITGNPTATEIDLSEYINTDEQTLSLDGRTLSISDGNSVELTSDIQDLTKSEHILTITGNATATEIDLSGYEQELSLDGRTLSISDGNSVELTSDIQDLNKNLHILTITGNPTATEIDLSEYINTDNQELSINGNLLSIARGNTVTLPAGEGTPQDLTISSHILTITDKDNPTEINLSGYQQNLSLNGNQLSISNGNMVELPAGGTAQDLSLTGHILTITDKPEPTEIDLSPYINTDSQTLSITDDQLTISGGNTVTLPASGGVVQDLTKTGHILKITLNDTATEIDLSEYANQTLSLNDDELSISGGNTVILPTGGGPKPCPEGFIAVNNRYCIQEDRSSSGTSWYNAIQNCFDLNGRLCSRQDWYFGCLKKDELELLNFDSTFEWTSENIGTSSILTVRGSSDCQSSNSSTPTGSLRFRCCFDR